MSAERNLVIYFLIFVVAALVGFVSPVLSLIILLGGAALYVLTPTRRP